MTTTREAVIAELARSRFGPRTAEAVLRVLVHGQGEAEAARACGIRHRQQVHEAANEIRKRLERPRCEHCGRPL